MTNVAIKIENVSKLYRLGEVGTGSLAHDINRWWHRIRGKEDPYAKIGQINDRTQSSTKNQAPGTKNNSTPDYVWALRDVSFEVKQGEVLGIIGRNGAGKSTLLKLLSRVTKPTTGTIRSKGRIASLLEVGTGFHPELTGRENIYLNGAILGMRKHEITRKLDEIVDFSGCERYIDTPVKRYSSGMYVRLAFAVAAHLEPEIMIIDEVLAVGDAEFQNKCLGKMQDVADSGRTVIFVSHNLGAVRQLCSEVVLIENGTKTFQGPTAEGLCKYEQTYATTAGELRSELHGPLAKFFHLKHFVLEQQNKEVFIIDPLHALSIRFWGISEMYIPSVEINLSFFRDGILVASCFDCETPLPLEAGLFTCEIDIPPNVLRPGRYSLGIGARASQTQWLWAADVASVEVAVNYGGKPPYRSTGILALPYVGKRL